MKSKKLYNLILKAGSIKHDIDILSDTPQKCLVNLNKIFRLKLILIKNKDIIPDPASRPIDQGYAKQEQRRKLRLSFKNKRIMLHEYPHLRDDAND
ncbi:hypothetical protein [Desulfovibrio sp. TomC]|uniref:hypothetical protein n=1 Tax=Desulfovibrio sp. TomC TaxID=1562888 RepID=UPI0012E2AC2F|nr:hypothetical protein [Desulfovibrio sp. TomC]